MIKTTNSQKQMYKNLMQRVLKASDSYFNYYLRQAVIYLVNDDRIKVALRKELGESFNMLINDLNRYAKYWEECLKYDKIIVDNFNDKKKIEFAQTKIKEICDKIPNVDASVIMLWSRAVFVTDLKDITIRVATNPNPFDKRINFNAQQDNRKQSEESETNEN
jgi:hypothetical protein